jgi:hypothetical protein
MTNSLRVVRAADNKMKVIIETSIIVLPYDYDNSLFDELLCKTMIDDRYS